MSPPFKSNSLNHIRCSGSCPVEDYQEDLTSSVEPQADIEEEQEPSRPAVEEIPAPVVAEPVGKQLDALQMLKDGHIEEAVEIYQG